MPVVNASLGAPVVQADRGGKHPRDALPSRRTRRIPTTSQRTNCPRALSRRFHPRPRRQKKSQTGTRVTLGDFQIFSCRHPLLGGPAGARLPDRNPRAWPTINCYDERGDEEVRESFRLRWRHPRTGWPDGPVTDTHITGEGNSHNETVQALDSARATCAPPRSNAPARSIIALVLGHRIHTAVRSFSSPSSHPQGRHPRGRACKRRSWKLCRHR